MVEQAENRLHLQKALMVELVRANEAARRATPTPAAKAARAKRPKLSRQT